MRNFHVVPSVYIIHALRLLQVYKLFAKCKSIWQIASKCKLICKPSGQTMYKQLTSCKPFANSYGQFAMYKSICTSFDRLSFALYKALYTSFDSIWQTVWSRQIGVALCKVIKMNLQTVCQSDTNQFAPRILILLSKLICIVQIGNILCRLCKRFANHLSICKSYANSFAICNFNWQFTNCAK